MTRTIVTFRNFAKGRSRSHFSTPVDLLDLSCTPTTCHSVGQCPCPRVSHLSHSHRPERDTSQINRHVYLPIKCRLVVAFPPIVYTRQLYKWHSQWVLIVTKGLGWRSGYGAALLVGRSRERFPVVSLDFSVTYSFRPYHGPGVDSAPRENEYQEHSWG
jgi:hypothetical protein